MAKQFHDLKFGDRFYFENQNSVTGFTLEQLNNIRSITMSRILCLTIDINYIQKFAFFIANADWNPIFDCSNIKNIPTLNFSLWKDNRPRTTTSDTTTGTTLPTTTGTTLPTTTGTTLSTTSGSTLSTTTGTTLPTTTGTTLLTTTTRPVTSRNNQNYNQNPNRNY